MAEPGWYPDPEGVPDRLRYWDGGRWTADTLDERRRRNRLITLLSACLALAIVITVVVVIMVRSDHGVVPDTRPPAAPQSGWDDSGPTATPSSSPPRPSSPTTGDHSASPSSAAPTTSRPSARCPAGEPKQAVRHARDGRVHGGQLSYAPVSGHGFDKPHVDDHFSWWYDEHAQTATPHTGAAAGRTIRVAVGSVAIRDGFRTAGQAAKASMRCVINTTDYAHYTGHTTVADHKRTIDGHAGRELITDVTVRGDDGDKTTDRIRLIVVDAGAPGSFSIFVGVSPAVDKQRTKIVNHVVAGLKIGH